MATSNNTEETIAKYAEGMKGVANAFDRLDKSLNEMGDIIAKLKDAIGQFKKCFN